MNSDIRIQPLYIGKTLSDQTRILTIASSASGSPKAATASLTSFPLPLCLTPGLNSLAYRLPDMVGLLSRCGHENTIAQSSDSSFTQ